MAPLHRNYAYVVLLVDPDEQCFVVVVEYAAAGGPVIIKICCSQETVTLSGNRNKGFVRVARMQTIKKQKILKKLTYLNKKQSSIN